MKTYYILLKIDRFRVCKEELSEWISKCSEFFSTFKWSLNDYAEYLL